MKPILFMVALLCFFHKVALKLPEPCSSRIYCYGPLLHTVQIAKLFEDSKTFVDMRTKRSTALTLMNFERLMFDNCNKPPENEIKKFVESNFEEGNQLIYWRPADFKENQTFLNTITDSNVRSFAQYLIKNWVLLGRKIKPEVFDNPTSTSLVLVPDGFIVPGGRFREFHYWDSYWIIKGLLLSEMTKTAHSIINNLFTVVKKYGFVPNGGRIYYTDRSQPPLLAKMIWIYYKYTKDMHWLKNSLHYLDTELRFWLDERTIQIKKNGFKYTVARYSAKSTGPRPESYYEDYTTVMRLSEPERREYLYTEIKTEAESGWDMSSRWVFDSKGGNNATQLETDTSRVLPVDLNSYLCEAFNIISELYSELGKSGKASFWRRIKYDWVTTIENLFWDEEDGMWYDMDLQTGNRRKYYYASNITPLWCKCLRSTNTEFYGNSALKYLKKVGALSSPGGISVSLTSTHEQWDYPNAWPPFQDIIVEALAQSGDPDAAAAAKKIAIKFLKTTMEAYKISNTVFEKYDASRVGREGGGGEYAVQTGFGWTTGVALNFIVKYYSSHYLL